MAAGTGTATFPTQAGEGVFSDIGGGVLSIAVGFLTGSAISNTNKALRALYEQANGLALDFAQFVVAELWWAAHLGTAASQLAGYMNEAQQHANAAADSELEAWREFLEHKYPADLIALYNELAGKIPKIHKVNLAPLEAQIRKLQADDRAEHKWRQKIADPKLTQWTAFYAAWRTRYRPPLMTLRDWLAHPAHLSSFLLPSLVAGMPSQLRSRASRSSAISIEQALLATWQATPDRMLDLLLTWLTTES